MHKKNRIQEQWDWNWKFLVLTHYTLLQLASFRRLLKVTRLCRNCLQSSIETVEGKLVAHIGGTGESAPAVAPSAEQNDVGHSARHQPEHARTEEWRIKFKNLQYRLAFQRKGIQKRFDNSSYLYKFITFHCWLFTSETPFIKCSVDSAAVQTARWVDQSTRNPALKSSHLRLSHGQPSTWQG